MKLGPLFADILIVDDDRDFIRAVRNVLQSAGYVVRVGDSSEKALAAQSNPPDLILLSAGFGYDLLRQLKKELAYIPIIIAAAGYSDQDMAAALNAGADEFLGKPIKNAELLARVRAMLRLKAATDELAELNATLERKVVERTQQLEQAHAQLRHSEKLSSLGRLAASLAHEINNPLTGILNYTYLIKAELPPDSAVQEDMAMVERQINLIAALVQQLRDFSKPPRRERRPVIIHRVLEDVLALTSKELAKNRIKVVKEFDPNLPAVLVSPEQMSEIFMNLVLNARDAMPEGGQLVIRTTACSDCVQVKVADTGTGIPPETLEHIFEPFFTTKGERGTGLGLSICYSIIQDHGGKIEVESQVGQGTKFIVQLPLSNL